MTDSQGPTSEISNADLMSQLRQMSAMIIEMKNSMDKMNGEIFELRQERDKLKKDIADSKRMEEELKRIATEAKLEASLAHRRTSDLEQYTRRNNIRVFGVEETDKETPADCEAKVIKVLHDKMGLRQVNGDHIEIAHRTGQKPESHTDPPRPIIVRFVSRKTVQAVFQNKKKMRQTNHVIVEDLTAENYNLLFSCKEHPSCDAAWSMRGKIFVRAKSGLTMHVETVNDLDTERTMDTPPEDFTTLLSSTPYRRRGTRGPRFLHGRGRVPYSRMASRPPQASRDTTLVHRRRLRSRCRF
ncbi:hypothetical protein BaRGS_00008934 [Batillaria attramentaria]|uniref:Uncharacterized protein n=1 Tax=Batillaria attramentaria TaxID=370345 RepID=A0ABD0LL09_9CAEN